MYRVLIIGYGNPLRSDDGLGWRVAQELSRRLVRPEIETEVVVCHQLTPELADNAKRADVVLFIDAARDGQPGEVTCTPVVLKPEMAHSHDCSASAVLALARQLYGVTPQAFVVTLCGECFDHGEVFSAPVESGIPKLIALVEKLLTEMIARL